VQQLALKDNGDKLSQSSKLMFWCLLVRHYQEPFVPLSQCPSKRNQLNSRAFQSKQYPITRSLFVVVKQNGQVEQQAGVAYANFLLSNQGQELINQSGFVKIR